MDKLLTIVIPTYNMQDYLRKCLDSLIIREDLMASVEVLVVNDGSRDDSSAIAHEYESRYPVTFRVIDKENGNYGSCVNRGLSEAKGKYIKVLDADDWFDTQAFAQYIVSLSYAPDVDMVLTDFNIVGPDGTVRERRSFDLTPGEPFGFQDYSETRAIFYMHAVTYRTQFLRDLGYRQTEGISYTDVEWVYLPMPEVDRCMYLPICLYQYLVGREGQTMSPASMVKSVRDHVKVAARLIGRVGQSPCGAPSHQRLESEIHYLGRTIYKTCLVEQSSKDFDGNLLKDFDKTLVDGCPEVYSDLGESQKLNGLPIRYIKFWRRTGSRLPLGTVRDLVRKIRYCK